MTCETAKLLIPFAPRDLAGDDQAALAEHLAGCTNCQSLANSFHADDAVIATAMKALTIPIGFRDSLQNQAITTQNALWRTKWLGRVAATAAAFLFVMLGAGLVSNLSKPTFDSEKLLADFEGGRGGSGAMAFDDFRATQGLPALPEDFDLRLMTFTGTQSFLGREVPAIRLQAAPGQDAVIYFLKNSRFDTATAGDAVGSQGSVRVFRTEGWTIVVAHTGPSLQPFLVRPGTAA